MKKYLGKTMINGINVVCEGTLGDFFYRLTDA